MHKFYCVAMVALIGLCQTVYGADHKGNITTKIENILQDLDVDDGNAKARVLKDINEWEQKCTFFDRCTIRLIDGLTRKEGLSCSTLFGQAALQMADAVDFKSKFMPMANACQGSIAVVDVLKGCHIGFLGKRVTIWPRDKVKNNVMYFCASASHVLAVAASFQCPLAQEASMCCALASVLISLTDESLIVTMRYFKTKYKLDEQTQKEYALLKKALQKYRTYHKDPNE